MFHYQSFPTFLRFYLYSQVYTDKSVVIINHWITEVDQNSPGKFSAKEWLGIQLLKS
jgi:hypothetical protein